MKMVMVAALWHWPENAKLQATPALLSPVWSMEEAGMMVGVRQKPLIHGTICLLFYSNISEDPQQWWVFLVVQ